MALGPFIPKSKLLAHSIAIRMSVMRPPKGRNFAEFLGSAFETELGAAGKLDPASPLRLEGLLTETHAGEDITKGSAVLAANITLLRSGKAIFSKPYYVERKWDSDFIGAIAISEAFHQYNALYALFVRQVLSDPEFVAAARQPAP